MPSQKLVKGSNMQVVFISATYLKRKFIEIEIEIEIEIDPPRFEVAKSNLFKTVTEKVPTRL